MAVNNRRKANTPVKTERRGAHKRSAKQSQPAKKGFPFLAVAIALLLAGFIGYFMFAVEKPAATNADSKKKTATKEEALPELPESKWDYEGALINKEVIVDIPEEKKSTVLQQMQCGSFRKKEDAESLKAQIAFQGLKSQVKQTGDWYRVILGPYERKRSAEKDRHKLQRAKINGCLIWNWR